MNNKIRLVIAVAGVLVLFTFYIFSREVKRGFLKQQDFNMTVRLQDHIPARLDGIWETIALPVTPAPSVFVVGLFTLAMLVDFRKKSAQGGSALGRKIRLRALIIPLLFGLIVMGELYGKSVVHHPSPPFFMLKHPTTVFPQFYVNEQFSYPSGHTSRAVFLGMVLFSWLTGSWDAWVKNWRKTIIIACAILAYSITVAVGRIYLGSHWLSDILGGGLLGAGLGLFSLAVL